MSETLRHTSEFIVPGRQTSLRQHLMYLRHLFAYEYVRTRVSEARCALELGCGEGYGIGLLSDKARRIVGLDVDREVVRHAAEKYGAENIAFQAYDGVSIPFAAGTFDLAFSFQVIEHVSMDRRYVEEIHRVLEPKGVLFLTTPNRLLRVSSGKKPWNRFHVREYSPTALNETLSDVFSEVEIKGVRGSEEIQRLELERLRSIRRIVSLDPFKLRNVVPEPVRQLVVRLLESRAKRRERTHEDANRTKRFSVSDYCVTEDAVEDSLDLLAICRKTA